MSALVPRAYNSVDPGLNNLYNYMIKLFVMFTTPFKEC